MAGDDPRPPDEPAGVLGNLPSTRPHRRSDKRPERTPVARRDQATPRTAGDADDPRPRAVRTGSPDLREAQERARAERARPDGDVPPTGSGAGPGDPLSAAIRAAGGLVRAVARRLPRL